MKKLIQKHFDQSVGSYRETATLQQEIAARCFSKIQGNTFPRTLEIGAGGGLLTETALGGLVLPELYAAVDISGSMLELISDRQACLIRADGEKLPFKEKSFDLLISSSCMQWYSQGGASIIQNLRMLRRNGFFSLALFIRGTFAEMLHINNLTGFGSIYPLPEPGTCFTCLERDHQDFESETEEHIIYFPSVRDFLQNHKKTGATYTRPGAAFGKKTYAKFCRLYENIYGNEKGIPVSYQVLYLWGRKK
ncbi:MAG: methyltransferase domain-containing protein [Desulfonatronovibrio sp.]